MNLPPAFFIAGTDTEVGKTYVSVQLIRRLVAEGKRVGVMKPVAAGCEWTEGEWRNGDALALMNAANLVQDYSAVNPFAFPAPISPHLAAKTAVGAVDIPIVKEIFNRIKKESQAVLVEGAGGWLTPISDHQSMADLAKALEIPVILVVGLRLGCLNHALLTVASIRETKIPLVGWIANSLSPDMDYEKENIEFLKNRLPAPLLEHFSYKKIEN